MKNKDEKQIEEACQKLADSEKENGDLQSYYDKSPTNTSDDADADLLGGSEADWPDHEESAEAAEGGEGFSNTPHTKPKLNACIDYLKFRFDVSYKECPGAFQHLFKVLNVNLAESEKSGVYNNYTSHLIMGVGLNLAYGGTMTRTSDGKETSLLELKGSACRDFEERRFDADPDGKEKGWEKAVSGYWVELINALISIGGTFTRIDLPTDLVNDYITIDEIKEKIAKREYTTAMRSLELTDDAAAPEFNNGQTKSLTGIATIKDSKLSGYTATFGTRRATQLCIYDKAAEQRSKNGNEEYAHWIRFEVRYYHENANQEIIPLLHALQSGTVKRHIIHCLATAIDFKEPNEKDKNHRSQAKQWDKWTALLGGIEKGSGFGQIRTGYSIETNIRWLIKDSAKSLTRVCLAMLVHPDIVGRLLVAKAISKLDKHDYQIINQYRESHGIGKTHDSSDLLEACCDENGELYTPPCLRKFFWKEGS